MYIPPSFQQTDLPTLHAFMQAHNFATLVSHHDGALAATHLPLMLDATHGEYGALIGHLARANPQAKTLAAGEVLVMFQGPHTYISPNWYETHPSVPTWNYTAVHAYGTPRIIDDAAVIHGMLAQLVDHHEAGFPQAWPMDLSDEFMAKQMKAIVAFVMPIVRLEGKYKLSQNRSETDQARVMQALGESAYAPDREVGAMMAAQKNPS